MRAELQPLIAAPLLAGPVKPTQTIAIVVCARVTVAVDLSVRSVVVRQRLDGPAVGAHAWEVSRLAGQVAPAGAWSQRYYDPPPYRPPLPPGDHTLVVRAVVDDLNWQALSTPQPEEPPSLRAPRLPMEAAARAAPGCRVVAVVRAHAGHGRR